MCCVGLDRRLREALLGVKCAPLLPLDHTEQLPIPFLSQLLLLGECVWIYIRFAYVLYIQPSLLPVCAVNSDRY